MARYCKVYPEDFERWIWIKNKLVVFKGLAWFETRDQLKEAARKLRRQFSIPMRSVTIPESFTDGGAYGGYDERYLLMVSCDHHEPDGLWDTVVNCEGYTRG